MPTYLPTLNWPIYSGWTAFTPTIPKMYWDVYSQEQRVKELCKNQFKMEQYLDAVAYLTNKWNGEYTEEVQDALNNLQNIVDNDVEQGILNWLQAHSTYIFENYVKQVYFGLTLDGYFVAYIPDGWNDIIFDTGMTYGLDTYGRLILRMNVDSPYNVDQTPESI